MYKKTPLGLPLEKNYMYSPIIASRKKNFINSYLCARLAVGPITIKSPLLSPPTRHLLRCRCGLFLDNRFSSLVLIVVIAVCNLVRSPFLLVGGALLVIRTWCAGSKVLCFDVFILLPAIMSCRLLHWLVLLLLVAIWTGLFLAPVFLFVVVGRVFVGIVGALVALAFEAIDDAA